jgi:hypothetical protein
VIQDTPNNGYVYVILVGGVKGNIKSVDRVFYDKGKAYDYASTMLEKSTMTTLYGVKEVQIS